MRYDQNQFQARTEVRQGKGVVSMTSRVKSATIAIL